jgi:hypothetical protein
MQRFFFLLSFFIVQIVFSQQAEIFKIKKFRVGYLSDSIKESSGLSFVKDKLYTINDSGNSADIFEINPNSGKIINVIKTTNSNKDWEAITNDGNNFYIGDFGNNEGARKDLKIIKIPIAQDSINFKQNLDINFYYPEQKDFTPRNLNQNFDGESLVFLNEKLHIFTKEWQSRQITHYEVDPTISDIQPAKLIEKFKLNFVATDAAYFNRKLYVVGYTKKTEVFLDIFTETEPGIFFKEKPKHYFLGTAFGIGQIEGIAVNEKGLYISGEKFLTPIGSAKPALYFIQHDKLP